jgi:hypothetical protein
MKFLDCINDIPVLWPTPLELMASSPKKPPWMMPLTHSDELPDEKLAF